jgi:hypothetical protein
MTQLAVIGTSPRSTHIAAIVEAWPTLPATIRAGILAMIESVGRITGET